nr:DUF6680 family protein [Enterobacter mori]
MSWVSSIELKDWLVVVATLLSPLIAVQVTKWIARKTQSRDEQVRIFKTLMATRGAPLDQRHVEALNMIDVVFHSKDKQQTQIRELWKQYLDHLNSRTYSAENWATRRIELLVELLHAMATYLGFDFDKTHIKNQSYFPGGYGDAEADLAVIRKAFRDLLTGEKALPMQIVNLPSQDQPSVDPVESTRD